MTAAARHAPEAHAGGPADQACEAGAGNAGPASEATTSEAEAAGADPKAEAEQLRTDNEAAAAAAVEADQAGANIELAEALAQRDEYLDALQRVKAEFDNYRKRVLRDQHDQRERAGQQLVEALLGAFDAFCVPATGGRAGCYGRPW